ncbi:3-oxoacyl-ACP synthase III [Terracoccus luteus]|jgi:3-oxoacyl-[acyl-carrier-protein] synthase III|uniref:3-oxoacyl-[acyl-carrier-protein] synthase-3 n=1 Tax=Terracoccus luteus TaxID=53356 RepID=A0A495XTP4_9MICO|nr:3-oxoacyl-ACP synthase III [Terracoccus luteus]MBB2988154.1 3-oxoacyl-[acyl-carrier-protein] synthase-3 [Terracoccus luteus]MCP2173789.1 3-oxoacyl-[acyl-carrier-protein] synthase-3 [Terracoccus luteus]RKT77900.1 3-oxoacyl-[acyl-carrier-protein] synthase-3 [Terracoccus luteus]
MSGNATFRYANTAVLSVCAVDAPVVMTSDAFDEKLLETYARVGLRSGMLERLAGIRERRWWPEGVSFTEGAATAGAKALAEAGIDPSRVGLMVNTSVSREHLEPSMAVQIHHALGLPTSCLNFDLANACLGFVNGMQLAATMIDAGQIDYAVVVDGESSRHTQEVTLERLSQPDATANDVLSQFATLTLGSGAAAMVLGRADQHPEGHRIVGGVARAGTEHHDLCVGDLEWMRTDTRGLLEAGIALSRETWEDAKAEFDWSDMDRYVAHQVSTVHTNAMCEALELPADRVPLTFPTRGNIGPAAVAVTLAQEVDSLQSGDRVLLLGVGSGLNVSCLEIAW